MEEKNKKEPHDRVWAAKVGAFLVSGNYNNTSKAGVFYTNINNTPDNTNVNIGFRAAFLNTCFSYVWVMEVSASCSNLGQ